jgi:hypothetical protein
VFLRGFLCRQMPVCAGHFWYLSISSSNDLKVINDFKAFARKMHPPPQNQRNSH